MKCMDPILCYTPLSKPGRQFRHFSLAGPAFKLLPHQVFSCGKCIFCRKKRATELAVRCVLHASLYTHNCFLTLTYDESRPEYHNRFEYRDIQLFKKNLRSYCDYHFSKKIQVFNVHEYGQNGKKHWHLVVFNHNFEDREFRSQRKGIRYYMSSTLSSLWPHGDKLNQIIGDVSEASAMYQAQYSQKDFRYGNSPLGPKKAHSKHSGIGFPYFDQNYKQILSLGHVPFNGRPVPIPRSFVRRAQRHYCHFYDKSKFFDTDQRKALFRPFKQGVANKEIADLYTIFIETKQEYVKTLEIEWEEMLAQHLATGEKPEFLLSAENALYDLNNKQQLKDF